MLKKLMAATFAGIAFSASAGLVWSQDDAQYIFRYRAGLIETVNGDGSTPDDGGDEEEPEQTQYTDIELNNGWHLYCPAAPTTSAASLAHLVGASIALKIDVDTIDTPRRACRSPTAESCWLKRRIVSVRLFVRRTCAISGKECRGGA
ncbi:hypothetical protein [Mesorhizobium sp. Root172]|uniref:hypothetical protein n=1 Tax=Mesorhizobium sp. Root172 TaxID=1736481 RepID=UPI0012E36D4D|nr:hypothetical protein [Mesorhizobium sp. Root172]